MVFFFQKMISVKIWYKIYNGRDLAIMKVFKIWYDYFKDCKHKVCIFIDYNNLHYFINIESLKLETNYMIQKLF